MEFSIHIQKLEVDAVIGVHAEERTRRQTLVLDLDLQVALPSIEDRQDTEGVVDYELLAEKIRDLFATAKFYLLEVATRETCRLCLDDPRVRSARVRVFKPGCLPRAAGVTAECRLAVDGQRGFPLDSPAKSST